VHAAPSAKDSGAVRGSQEEAMIDLADFEIHAPQIGDGRIESSYLVLIHKRCGDEIGEYDMIDLDTAVDAATEHECNT
jgi:hypothetical protein